MEHPDQTPVVDSSVKAASESRLLRPMSWQKSKELDQELDGVPIDEQEELLARCLSQIQRGATVYSVAKKAGLHPSSLVYYIDGLELQPAAQKRAAQERHKRIMDRACLLTELAQDRALEDLEKGIVPDRDLAQFYKVAADVAAPVLEPHDSIPEPAGIARLLKVMEPGMEVDIKLRRHADMAIAVDEEREAIDVTPFRAKEG